MTSTPATRPCQQPAPPRSRAAAVLRGCAVAAASAFCAFCLLVLAARWFVLPQVNSYKDDIAALISRATGVNASIGAITPRWDEVWPELQIKRLRFEKPGLAMKPDAVLELPEVTASFYWSSLLGAPRLRKLSVINPALSIRLKPGALDVAGFEIPLGGRSEGAGEAGAGRSGLQAGLAVFSHPGRLNIIGARISFTDLTVPEAQTLQLQDLNFSLRHKTFIWRFGLQADIAGVPDDLIDLRGEVQALEGRLSDGSKHWAGRVYGRVAGLDAGYVARKLSLGSLLPSGRLDAAVLASFARGAVTSLKGALSIPEVTLNLPGMPHQLTFTDVGFNVEQARDEDGWSLLVKDISCNSRDIAMSFAPDMISARINAPGPGAEPSSVTVTGINVKHVSKMLLHLPLPGPVADALGQALPSGQVPEATLRWRGGLEAFAGGAEGLLAARPEASAVFAGLSVRASRAGLGEAGWRPGVRNLTGEARVSAEGGSVTLAAADCGVSLPGLFERAETRFDKLEGAVRWETPADGPPAVRIESLRLANGDAEAAVRGSWRATGGAGTIDLTGDILRARAESVWKYIPLVVAKDAREWLRGGLLGGLASDGKLRLRGRLDDFPWTAAGQDGEFRVDAKVSDVALDYQPSMRTDSRGRLIGGEIWPLLTRIRGRISFSGLKMTVKADGASTMGVAVGKTEAVIPDLTDESNLALNIEGSGRGPLQSMFEWLDRSPVGKLLGDAFKGTRATGEASLGLKLWISLTRPEATRVDGTVAFADNAVSLPSPAPPLKGVSGDLRFTHRGAEAKGLSASAFGLPVKARVSTVDTGVVRVDVSGSASPASLTHFYDAPLMKEVLAHTAGASPFEASVVVGGDGGPVVDVKTSLKGTAVRLPAPLAKPAAQACATSFRWEPAAKGASDMLSLDFGAPLNAHFKLRLPRGKGDAAGVLALGKASALPPAGFAIDVKAGAASLDDWTPVVLRIVKAAAAPAAGGKGKGGAGLAISRVDAELGDLRVGGNGTGKASLHTLHAPGRWNFKASSALMSGEGVWLPDKNTAGTLRLHFEKLHIPADLAGHIGDTFTFDEKGNPEGYASEDIPSLDIVIDDLTCGKLKPGKVAYRTRNVSGPRGEAWLVDLLKVENRGGAVQARGAWQENGLTTLSGKVDVRDAGRLLASLGYPKVITGGKGTIAADLSWAGPVWAPKLGTLAGDWSLDLRDGSFRQVDTGVGGALLSIISMQSLMRRLQFDFSDLSRKGFAFDTITAKSTVMQGVCLTENWKVVGPQATIMVSGKVDVARALLDLKALVLPDINAGGASLAFAAVNPAIGLGTFVAQFLLRNPLQHLFAAEYEIKGPFSKPDVRKVERAAPADEARADP
ncbi:MAG: TIGR02099 family protein [Duodenibacillus sp.]|nr:TIGR02099 family protein [Duodenibacillus sp.]